MKKRKFANGGSVPDMNSAIELARQGDKSGAEDILRQMVGLPSVAGTEAGLREAVGLPANPTQQLRNTVGIGQSAQTPVVRTPDKNMFRQDPANSNIMPKNTVIGGMSKQEQIAANNATLAKSAPVAAPARSAAYNNMVANRQQVLANRAKAPVKFAKGGSVSSRGDGCAQRGKTKGRMV